MVRLFDGFWHHEITLKLESDLELYGWWVKLRYGYGTHR